jgi:hypothetical protein
MLFTKPIQEITYEDIVNFCGEDHLEGSILEYKSQLPDNDKIAKSLSAFANTYGGVFIVGVNAPSGKPEPPFEGFDFDPAMKYEEKIESICLAHIKEPIFPEIHVCEPVDNKTFIVVRIAESPLTPHRVANNTRVYVRTGQSSTPNEEADWGKIEWLASRREKSIELRERLKQEADQYFLNACKLKGVNLNDKKAYFATLSLKLIPLFPQTPIIDFSRLESIGNVIDVNHFQHFPAMSLYKPPLIRQGIHKLEFLGGEDNQPNHGKSFKYIYLNSFGVYSFKEDIGKVVKPEGQTDVKIIKLSRIMTDVHYFLLSAIQFYKEIGYFGNLQFKIEIEGALGVNLYNPLASQYNGDIDLGLKVTSDQLQWERETNLPQLVDNTVEVSASLIHDIIWSLGIRGYDQDRIRESIRANVSGR